MNPIDCRRVGRRQSVGFTFKKDLEMKYTIEGFSQEAALNMQATITENGKTKTIRLDCTDLLILRWIVDFYPSMHKTTIEGAEYAWVSYDGLLEDMPLLGIGKRALFDRLKKMEQLGILTHKTVTRKGTFSFYGFGENYKLLTSRNTTPATTKTAPPTPEQDPWGNDANADTTQFQTPTDEPQPLIPESQPTERQDKPDDIDEVINHLNHRLGTHYKTTTQATRKLIKARLKEGFTVEDMKLVIDKKATEWVGNQKMAQYLRPDILFGNKFEGYLNANATPQNNWNNNPSHQSPYCAPVADDEAPSCSFGW